MTKWVGKIKKYRKPIDEIGKWGYNTAITYKPTRFMEKGARTMMMEYGMCCCRMSGRRAWNAYGENRLCAQKGAGGLYG